ncbi:MAG: aspartate carbamoyltransferase catalytic subunit [bacterium]|nr:aspartate carbamoyltransferase catalytic subunit [bacterium]
MAWDKKDLLGLEYLSAEEILTVLDTARAFSEVSTRAIKKVPALRGKTVVNLFYEASTRTRASFELAEKRLSADIINMNVSTSSVTKGETLLDTVRNLCAYKIDVIVIRHAMSGAPIYLARNIECSVVNAGDGMHEHPTQALLDIYTLREKLGDLRGRRIVIVGDIAHSRVARSNIWGLTKLGAQVTVVGPSTLIPREIEQMGVRVQHNLDEALRDADAVNMLRIQREREKLTLFPSLREYAILFGLNRTRMQGLPDKLIVMHPGPINRGVELSGSVADGPNSVILEQVTNSLAVRMAVLFLVTGGTSLHPEHMSA